MSHAPLSAVVLAVLTLALGAADARRPGTEGCLKGADQCHGNGMACGKTVVCCRAACQVSALTCALNSNGDADEDACNCEACDGHKFPPGFHMFRIPRGMGRMGGRMGGQRGASANPLSNLLGGLFNNGMFHKPTAAEIARHKKALAEREARRQSDYHNALSIDEDEQTHDDDGLVEGYQKALKAQAKARDDSTVAPAGAGATAAATDEGTGLDDRGDMSSNSGLRGGANAANAANTANAANAPSTAPVPFTEAWYWMAAKWVSTLVVLPFFVLLAFKLHHNYAAHKRMGAAGVNAFGTPVPSAPVDVTSAVGSAAAAAGPATTADVAAGAGYQADAGAESADTAQLLGEGQSQSGQVQGGTASYEPPPGL